MADLCYSKIVFADSVWLEQALAGMFGQGIKRSQAAPGHATVYFHVPTSGATRVLIHAVPKEPDAAEVLAEFDNANREYFETNCMPLLEQLPGRVGEIL